MRRSGPSSTRSRYQKPTTLPGLRAEFMGSPTQRADGKVSKLQTPYGFDLAQSCKHLFVLFVNACSFRHADELDHISMAAGHDDKGIHASEFPGADVFTGYVGSVVHDVGPVQGADTVVLFRVPIRPQHWRQHVGDAGSCRRLVVSGLVAVLDDLLELA